MTTPQFPPMFQQMFASTMKSIRDRHVELVAQGMTSEEASAVIEQELVSTVSQMMPVQAQDGCDCTCASDCACSGMCTDCECGGDED